MGLLRPSSLDGHELSMYDFPSLVEYSRRQYLGGGGGGVHFESFPTATDSRSLLRE